MPEWSENWWKVKMILSGTVNTLHTQKPSLKYLFFTVTQSVPIALHFFSWGAAEWEILLHICFVCLCKVQLVSRLFSSFVFLLNLSLLLMLLQPWRPVAVKREGLEGETAFFIWRKSKQVVRHLNSFSALKCLLYNKWKLDFHFQHYLLKVFSWLPLRAKLCRSLVEGVYNKWGLCVVEQYNL